MSVRLTFMCATAGDTSRNAVFGDGLLSEHGLHEARLVGAALPPYSLAIRAPSTRCGQIADALGLNATHEPALRDFDYGTWRGRTVGEVTAYDPYGYGAWLTDPDAAPHGGESVRQLCRRTAGWLSRVPPGTGDALAITEPAIIRAALVHALSAPPTAFWHFDVPPLSAVSLTLRGDHWNVRPGPVIPRGVGTSRTVPVPCVAARNQTTLLWDETANDERYDLVAWV
ncbi:histidine phosphatase family protein [Streptomyces mirabilis]|uniref:histidine phosphatase family protein n=1 Tax=Streptomyces TaxID=1883 RepID=UPI0011647960|nr:MULTISPECIES: histidine phosphatase family protein [Streptomyces]MCX4616926.1 histidine phosphatase family protein [Streptomyces mirabilis]MCX5355155.1 histidine phosphatase family protein [Streptomyces mirabilis]QDN92899.1 histidine phosphatase family protein [Streptomyces sp. RLB3-6]QDO13720.1 histidine phosphatase family protein [Streptomyces sp. S1D4-23]